MPTFDDFTIDPIDALEGLIAVALGQVPAPRPHAPIAALSSATAAALEAPPDDVLVFDTGDRVRLLGVAHVSLPDGMR